MSSHDLQCHHMTLIRTHGVYLCTCTVGHCKFCHFFDKLINFNYFFQDKLLLASSNDFACRVWTYCDGRLRVSTTLTCLHRLIHLKTRKLSQISKQVVTRLLSSRCHDVFALFLPSCRDKSGTSCYHLVTRLMTVTDLFILKTALNLTLVWKSALPAYLKDISYLSILE